MLKKIRLCSLLAPLVTLAGCQIVTERSSPAQKAAPAIPPSIARPSEVSQPSDGDTAPTISAPPQAASALTPKVGLILGPGVLRSFAHVGVVQEFAKQKMPIHSIGGIEMGALVAAIYANKGLPYDVEWQMMKLKESDLVQKGLLSSQVKSGDVRALREFISTALSSAKAENSKVPFVCPSLNMDRQQVFMMNRGAFVDMLSFCLAAPPLFKAHQQSVAALQSLRAVADNLRSRGANFIVYVDVLQGPLRLGDADLEARILWSLTGESLSRREKSVDYVLNVPLKDFDLLDFNRRREMIQRGQQAAQEAVPQIMKLINW